MIMELMPTSQEHVKYIKDKIPLPDLYEQLAEEVRRTACRLAEEILDGSAEAAPAVWKDTAGKERTACDYCPYRGVCGFDPAIDGYGYRDR